jgi:hypothetical protein
MRRRAAYLAGTQRALTDRMTAGIQNETYIVHMPAVYGS